MIHLNGNLLAAVDVETTGTVPGKHDIWQVCVLLLDGDIQPDKRVAPFYMELKPKRPDNIDPKAISIGRMEFAMKMQRANDPWDAAEWFDEWFEKLKKQLGTRPPLLPEGKKLVPVAQNWPFDRSFLIDWLGHTSFEAFFHPWYRDTLPVAQYLNDRYSKDTSCVLPAKVPFPKSNLGYLCSQLKVKNLKAHDALQDCIATAECYRLMVLGHIP